MGREIEIKQEPSNIRARPLSASSVYRKTQIPHILVFGYFWDNIAFFSGMLGHHYHDMIRWRRQPPARSLVDFRRLRLTKLHTIFGNIKNFVGQNKYTLDEQRL